MSHQQSFTDEQARAFFAFVSTMEEKRYAEGHGQVPHAPLVFALSAASGQPAGFLEMAGFAEDAPQEAIRMVLTRYEAAAYVREGLGVLMISLHRPHAPVASWCREIVTDGDGRRFLACRLQLGSAPSKTE